MAGTAITERLACLGPNIVGTDRVRALTVLGGQVRNPLILLLLLCAGVSGSTGDPTDAVIIAVIIGLSVALGFFNEYRAEAGGCRTPRQDPSPDDCVERRLTGPPRLT